MLDTDSYVETVAPLADDAAVRQAVANRLADEIIVRTEIEGLAAEVADRLLEQGAPERFNELVGPARGYYLDNPPCQPPALRTPPKA